MEYQGFFASERKICRMFRTIFDWKELKRYFSLIFCYSSNGKAIFKTHPWPLGTDENKLGVICGWFICKCPLFPDNMFNVIFSISKRCRLNFRSLQLLLESDSRSFSICSSCEQLPFIVGFFSRSLWSLAVSFRSLSSFLTLSCISFPMSLPPNLAFLAQFHLIYGKTFWIVTIFLVFYQASYLPWSLEGYPCATNS